MGRVPVLPGGRAEYEKLHQWSLEDPDGFWSKVRPPAAAGYPPCTPVHYRQRALTASTVAAPHCDRSRLDSMLAVA